MFLFEGQSTRPSPLSRFVNCPLSQDPSIEEVDEVGDPVRAFARTIYLTEAELSRRIGVAASSPSDRVCRAIWVAEKSGTPSLKD